MKIFHLFYIFLFILFINIPDAHSVFGFIKRGFQHCTGVCDKDDVCSIENDAQYRWCVKNCSHKIKVKEKCEAHLPTKLRPILPYEKYSGSLDTNQVSPLALQGLDADFIRQTSDKRRLVGTAKRVLLVKEQYLNNKDVQKLSGPEREALAEKLFLDFFKGVPQVIDEYRKTGAIPDDKMNILFKELKSEILNKWRRENIEK